MGDWQAPEVIMAMETGSVGASSAQSPILQSRKDCVFVQYGAARYRAVLE